MIGSVPDQDLVDVAVGGVLLLAIIIIVCIAAVVIDARHPRK